MVMIEWCLILFTGIYYFFSTRESNTGKNRIKEIHLNSTCAVFSGIGPKKLNQSKAHFKTSSNAYIDDLQVSAKNFLTDSDKCQIRTLNKKTHVDRKSSKD